MTYVSKKTMWSHNMPRAYSSLDQMKLTDLSGNSFNDS